ncbi:MAG: hypothetical protein Q7S38_00225 [bacterium]|nr:hypothetical protein [bacterium]
MNKNEGGNRSSFTDGRQTVKRLTREHNSPPKKEKVGQNNPVNPTVDTNDANKDDNRVVLSSATPLDIVQRLEEQDRRFLEFSSQGTLTRQWSEYGRRRSLSKLFNR